MITSESRPLRLLISYSPEDQDLKDASRPDDVAEVTRFRGRVSFRSNLPGIGWVLRPGLAWSSGASSQGSRETWSRTAGEERADPISILFARRLGIPVFVQRPLPTRKA